jgi:hypothetical protein
MNRRDLIFFEFFGFFIVDIITPWLSILVYHLGDEQQALWWPQFRDLLSSHRLEKQGSIKQ